MFEETSVWKTDNFESDEYIQWQTQMIELATNKLSNESVIELAYYLAFEAKHNDKYVWRAVETAALNNFHLYELKHVCQLQWAVTQLKPKHTTARFDDMLHSYAREKIDKGLTNQSDFHHVMQGFRNKKSKDFYLKLKQLLID